MPACKGRHHTTLNRIGRSALARNAAADRALPQGAPSPSPSDMRSLGCECYRDAHKEDGSEPDWKPLDGDAGSGRQPARSTERHPKVAISERAELCGEKS